MDTIIGDVLYAIDKETIKIQVTHIGNKNKFDYNSKEIVVVDKIGTKLNLKKLIGRQICCSVKWRDEYNRLRSEVELNKGKRAK